MDYSRLSNDFDIILIPFFYFNIDLIVSFASFTVK